MNYACSSARNKFATPKHYFSAIYYHHQHFPLHPSITRNPQLPLHHSSSSLYSTSSQLTTLLTTQTKVFSWMSKILTQTTDVACTFLVRLWSGHAWPTTATRRGNISYRYGCICILAAPGFDRGNRLWEHAVGRWLALLLMSPRNFVSFALTNYELE